MKNSNKVRTKEQHKIGRGIVCKDEFEANLFVLLYRNRCNKIFVNKCYKNTVYLTTDKDEFEKIKDEYGLVKNGKSIRNWKTLAAGE